MAQQADILLFPLKKFTYLFCKGNFEFVAFSPTEEDRFGEDM